MGQPKNHSNDQEKMEQNRSNTIPEEPKNTRIQKETGAFSQMVRSQREQHTTRTQGSKERETNSEHMQLQYYHLKRPTKKY